MIVSQVSGVWPNGSNCLQVQTGALTATATLGPGTNTPGGFTNGWWIYQNVGGNWIQLPSAASSIQIPKNSTYALAPITTDASGRQCEYKNMMPAVPGLNTWSDLSDYGGDYGTAAITIDVIENSTK
jgi:hypothetical protein